MKKRQEFCYVGIWNKNIPGRGTSLCKGPEAHRAYLRKIREVRVVSVK